MSIALCVIVLEVTPRSSTFPAQGHSPEVGQCLHLFATTFQLLDPRTHAVSRAAGEPFASFSGVLQVIIARRH